MSNTVPTATCTRSPSLCQRLECEKSEGNKLTTIVPGVTDFIERFQARLCGFPIDRAKSKVEKCGSCGSTKPAREKYKIQTPHFPASRDWNTKTMQAMTRRVGIRSHRKFTTTAISFGSTSRSVSLPPPLYDLTDILSDPEYIKKNLRDRKYPLEPEIVDRIRQLEFDSIRTKKELQSLKESRNTLSKLLAAKQGTKEQKEAATTIKLSIKSLEPDLARLTESIQDLLANLPNTSHPTSPIGDESKARIVATYGPSISQSTPPPPDPARDHLHLSSPTNLNWTDFSSASLVSGASWPYLLREGALLEMALINYSMSKVVKQGFVPVLTPDVVKSEIADRCGFKPRDGEAQQTYFLSDGTPSSSTPPALCLVGTAEIPLVALSAATVTPYASLPLKYVALGRAFRAEAGARGAESRGLYRVHQFSKVEMVVICGAESSDRILEDLRKTQETILITLGLSLRSVDLSDQMNRS